MAEEDYRFIRNYHENLKACIQQFVFTIGLQKYSGTSANEDNSFRNHIR
jgi:hypothetical protein